MRLIYISFSFIFCWQPPVKNQEERPGFPASKPVDNNKGWFKKCTVCLLGGTFDKMFSIIDDQC